MSASVAEADSAPVILLDHSLSLHIAYEGADVRLSSLPALQLLCCHHLPTAWHRESQLSRSEHYSLSSCPPRTRGG